MPFYTNPQVQPLPGDPYKQQNAMSSPMSPWAAQPKPASTAGAMTTQRNAFQLPAGFNIGAGSQDQALNRQVYGNSYFPGNLPNYQGINTQEQFGALDPSQQAGYRQALYRQNQLNQYLGPQQGYGDRFSYSNVQDFSQNPAYQNQLRESERAINRHLLSTGRSDSSGAVNAFARNARNLGGEFEQQAYQRAQQEEQMNYARGFAENESMYGRQFAAQKYLDDLGIRQDDINYNRILQLMLAGAQPGPT